MSHPPFIRIPITMHRYRYLLSALALLLVAPLAAAQPLFEEVSDAFDLTIISWGASWVDADDDGDLDLFVSRHSATGGNLLLRNTGSGFESADAGALTDAATPGSLGHTWADYDNDGDLDVYAVGGWSSGAGRLFRNDGGTFTVVDEGPLAPAEDNRGWSAAWGDYDNDGLVDLVVAHPQGFVGTGQPNHLFRNEGEGAFSRVTGTPITEGLAPYTIPSWSDYDLDGDLDLFIGSGPADGSAAPDYLYENTGDGTFSRITTAPIATDPRDGQVMNWVDTDNDGDLDLYVTSYAGADNALYRNDSPNFGAGPYVEVTDTPLDDPVDIYSLANTWGDLDNDGDLDVVVSVSRNSTSQTGYNKLYLNDGDGTFTAVTDDPLTTVRESTAGATLGDYDGDGDLDIATTSWFSGTPNLRLYRNVTDGGNGWLKLDLVGVESNRAAIGAKVRATATIGGETVTQFREVSAQNTFGGQNALTVHIGLGDAAAVDVLEITWPSGTVDTFTDVPVRASFEVTEGEEMVPVAGEETLGTAAPAGAMLEAAYPNPFHTASTIRYAVAAAGRVRLAIYDVLGRRIATLVDADQPAGPQTVQWDGTNASGHRLSAGVYLVRLEAGGETLSRRVTLLR